MKLLYTATELFLSTTSGILAGLLILYGVGLIDISFSDDSKVYEVRTCEDLKNIKDDLDGTYILMNDISGVDCK
jgi:hypothetical protein